MSLRIIPPPADIFETAAYAIVVPVNCVGTPGKGLALAAAKRWPTWAADYRKACNGGRFKPGDMMSTHLPHDTQPDGRPRRVIGLAVKDHWRYPSRLEWIEDGLHRIAAWCREALPTGGVAVPAIGCGLGLLRWDDVRPLMLRILMEVRVGDVLIYEPHEGQRRKAARRR